MKKEDRYYFPCTDWGACTQKCMAKNSGTMIGSVSCQECEFCTEFEDEKEPTWIKCSRINEATNIDHDNN